MTKDRAPGVLVLNERAGSVVSSSVEEVTRKLRAGYERAGVSPPPIVVCRPDELEATLQKELAAGRQWIVVGGGDGSVATAASILRGSETALGVVPLGTFNLMGRDLRMPLDPEQAGFALATATPRMVDVAEVNGRLFLCVCILGFFPDVAMRRDLYRGYPWWRKTMAITQAMLRSYVDYPSLRLNLESDKESMKNLSFTTRFVAVSNNVYKEESGLIPHKADLAGGELAAYVSRHHSIPEVVRGSLSFVSGAIGSDPLLELQTCKHLRIESESRSRLRVAIDGEILKMEAPLEFKICPGALKVLQPEKERRSNG